MYVWRSNTVILMWGNGAPRRRTVPELTLSPDVNSDLRSSELATMIMVNLDIRRLDRFLISHILRNESVEMSTGQDARFYMAAESHNRVFR